MNKALLDTDTLSELGKGVDRRVLSHGIGYLASFGRYTISVVTVMEVVRGLRKKQAGRQLQVFLANLPALELLIFDRDAAELAGRIEGDLERQGLSIGRADPMIAATALGDGLELVTGNTAHYERIQKLGYPLVLRNWRA